MAQKQHNHAKQVPHKKALPLLQTSTPLQCQWGGKLPSEKNAHWSCHPQVFGSFNVYFGSLMSSGVSFRFRFLSKFGFCDMVLTLDYLAILRIKAFKIGKRQVCIHASRLVSKSLLTCFYFNIVICNLYLYYFFLVLRPNFQILSRLLVI